MSAPPYQKLFWGSYHKHTAHLRHAREHGAYLLLIGALWNNDGRLPADDDTLAAYAMLTTKEWLAIKPKLMPLFRIVRGKLTQPRVTEDLAKFRDISCKRKEAGKAGGSASAGKHRRNTTASAIDLPTKSEPEPYKKKNPRSPQGGSAADFDRFWEAYPSKVGKRAAERSFTAAARRLKAAGRDPLPTMLAGLERAKASARWRDPTYTIPNPTTWLNQDRWDDGAPVGEATVGAPAPTFDGPPELRRAVVEAKDEEFALRWLTGCSWNPEGRQLVARNRFTAETLRRELGPHLERWRVEVVERERVAA